MTSPNLVARNWRELIRPRNVPVDQESLTDTYGKFVVEPLERGFGITLGNSLRRVLLSSLQGAAITAVKLSNFKRAASTPRSAIANRCATGASDASAARHCS